MKIYRRPMFRKGGSTGEGVMYNVKPRTNFQNGTTEKMIKDRSKLYRQYAGDPIANLLIQGGLGLVSGEGAGKGTLGSIATAFQKPVAQALAQEQQIGLKSVSDIFSRQDAERIARLKARQAKPTNYQSMLNNELISMFGRKDSYSQDEISKANDAVQSFMKQGTAKDVLSTVSDLNIQFEKQGYPNPLRAAQVFTQYKGSIVLVPPISYKYDKGIATDISEDFKKTARPGTTYYDSKGDRFIQFKKMDDNTVQMIEVPAPEIK